MDIGGHVGNFSPAIMQCERVKTTKVHCGDKSGGLKKNNIHNSHWKGREMASHCVLTHSLTSRRLTSLCHNHLSSFSATSTKISPRKTGSLSLISKCSWFDDKTLYCNNATNVEWRVTSPKSVTSSSPAIVSSVEDLFDFICMGPLMKNLGYTSETVAEKIDRWLECGLYLCRLFKLNELDLTVPQKARIYHYYVPVFFWCENQLLHHMSTYKDGEEIAPLMIGFSAPQGSGKTTLVFALNYLFRCTGRNCATLSIDDFYLKAEDQAKLRTEHPGNALLEYRGNAGSHDLQFSIDTLAALSKLTKEGMKMKLPRYDKSAFGGRGDRADPSTWPEVEGPITVVLFEGWMLGFKPLSNEVVKAIDPQLEIVNKNLEAYYDAWDKYVKAWVIIKIKDPTCVFQWRLQAEVAMREEGKPGMSDDEVMDFVSRYLPAYEAYLPTLYSEGPMGSNPNHLLIVDIDEARNPIRDS